MPRRYANWCIASMMSLASACAPRAVRRVPAPESNGKNTHIILAGSGERPAEAWEYHFAQSLGIDAPVKSIELYIADRAAAPRVRLILIRRPVENRIEAALELEPPVLCFERADGTTTTFHVRGETPEGPLDWRFAWPEPVSPDEALQITIGLYREPSRPVLVEAPAP